MKVSDVLDAMDVAKQLEAIYDLLISVLEQQDEIYYHGNEECVSEAIRGSVVSGLIDARDEAKSAFEAHLLKEIKGSGEEE